MLLLLNHVLLTGKKFKYQTICLSCNLFIWFLTIFQFSKKYKLCLESQERQVFLKMMYYGTIKSRARIVDSRLINMASKKFSSLLCPFDHI